MYESRNDDATNAEAINKIRNLGIWIPGDGPGDDDDSRQRFEGALHFWGEVFEWKAKATTTRQRQARQAQAERLIANLNCSYQPKSGVYLNKPYYQQNKDLAYRFFRTVQSRIEEGGGTWCWSKGPHTALSWETPQTEDSADNIT